MKSNKGNGLRATSDEHRDEHVKIAENFLSRGQLKFTKIPMWRILEGSLCKVCQKMDVMYRTSCVRRCEPSFAVIDESHVQAAI